MSEPTILVIGATGNVGAEVVRLLHAQGIPIRVAVRNPERSGLSGAGISPVAFDFMRPGTWTAAFAGIDQLFLMRPPAISDVRKHLNPALDAARAAGVRHVVLLSLLGAEKNPLLPHRRIEQHLEQSGPAWTFLRASFFMQNLSTTHRREIREQGVIAVPAGDGKTSFVDVRDLAAVAVKALTGAGHEGQAYDLTGAQALTYHEVAGILSGVLGRKITYTNPSLPAFVARMRREGHPLAFALVTGGIYTTARLGLAGRVTTAVTDLLGCPPISMQQFAEDYRACWDPKIERCP